MCEVDRWWVGHWAGWPMLSSTHAVQHGRGMLLRVWFCAPGADAAAKEQHGQEAQQLLQCQGSLAAQ